MSEQTPDASSAMAESHEPSMEDILASIRKIIADDDAGEMATAAAEAPGFSDVTPEGVSDISAQGDTLDLDVLTDTQDIEIPAIEAPSNEVPELMSEVAPDSDLLLSGADDATETTQNNDGASDVLDLEIEFDDIPEDSPAGDNLAEVRVADPQSADDASFDEVLSIIGEDIAEVASEEPNADDETAQVTEKDDDFSLMLDDMLTEDAGEDEDVAVETATDPADALLEEDDVIEGESVEELSSGDADIDLVKSLMAELTEEPLHDELDAAELEIPDINAGPEIETEAEDVDVMDEILSMTLDDEVQLQKEAAIADAVIVTESAQDPPIPDNSLLAIAAQAKADAEGLSSGAKAGLGTVLGGGALMSAATLQGEDKAPPVDDVDSVLDELDALIAKSESPETDLQIPDPEPTPEEDTEMPRAKKADTIIDEVTETATADVFASLNKVVEEKATVAERGDRIGDLVMEALRPMLKDWLDTNLKGIVERAVTKEVKRISSGK